MADMLTEYKPNRPLRSLGSSQLEIPRVHTKQGESTFSYYAFGFKSWNQLPDEIRAHIYQASKSAILVLSPENSWSLPLLSNLSIKASYQIS